MQVRFAKRTEPVYIRDIMKAYPTNYKLTGIRGHREMEGFDLEQVWIAYMYGGQSKTTINAWHMVMPLIDKYRYDVFEGRL